MDDNLLDNFLIQVLHTHLNYGPQESIVDPMWSDLTVDVISDADEERWQHGQDVGGVIEKLCVFVAETLPVNQQSPWTKVRWAKQQQRMLLGEILEDASLIKASSLGELYGQSLADFLKNTPAGTVDSNLIAELPFGLHDIDKDLKESLYCGDLADGNRLLLSLVGLLTPGNIAVFMVTQNFRSIIRHLPKCNAELMFVIRCDSGVYPETAHQSFLIAIKKVESVEMSSRTFFSTCETDSTKFDPVDEAEAFITKEPFFEDSAFPAWLDADGYISFKQIEIERLLKRFQDLYEGHDLIKMEELITDCVIIKEPDVIDADPSGGSNSIYFTGDRTRPLTLTQPKKVSLGIRKLHLSDRVSFEYLYAFLMHTEFGRTLLASRETDGMKPGISLGDFKTLEIPLPSLSDQSLFLDARKKLQDAGKAMLELDGAMTLDGGSSRRIADLANSVIVALGQETQTERLHRLILEGENETVEYKETFSLNIHTKKKDDAVIVSALKTVVGFLNSSGGTLLIGVSDRPSVTGVDVEIEMFDKGSSDRFVNRFKDSVKRRIGAEFFTDIKFSLQKFSSEERVLVVETAASDRACYLDGKDFYARTNPATEKLEGPKLVEYTRKRFPS